MILSLEMVFGGLGGFLFLGETLTLRETAGVLAMTAGVFLSQIESPAVVSFAKNKDTGHAR